MPCSNKKYVIFRFFRSKYEIVSYPVHVYEFREKSQMEHTVSSVRPNTFTLCISSCRWCRSKCIVPGKENGTAVYHCFQSAANILIQVGKLISFCPC